MEIFSTVCVTAASSKKDPPVPKFSDKYHTSGTIRLPYAELNEPFEVFYDGKLKASVMDLYYGECPTVPLSGPYLGPAKTVILTRNFHF